MPSSISGLPPWLAKQSTFGAANWPLPPSLNSSDELGFTLPDPPTTATEAVNVMRRLRAPGVLPNTDAYTEGRRNRLAHEVLKLILQCLDVWSADPSNKDVATYTWSGKDVRNFQVSPLVVIFKGPVQRDVDFVFDIAVLPDVPAATEEEKAAQMENEKLASGHITGCVANHRVGSANLYLVSTEYDITARKNGGANHDHEVAVLITPGSDHIYIYDPWFNIKDWAGGPKKLAHVPMMGRVRELFKKLGRAKKETNLKNNTAQIIIGGGGLREGGHCRAMCMSWMVEVVCTQWMGLDGPVDVANHPPLYFDSTYDQAKIHW